MFMILKRITSWLDWLDRFNTLLPEEYLDCLHFWSAGRLCSLRSADRVILGRGTDACSHDVGNITWRSGLYLDGFSRETQYCDRMAADNSPGMDPNPYGRNYLVFAILVIKEGINLAQRTMGGRCLRSASQSAQRTSSFLPQGF